MYTHFFFIHYLIEGQMRVPLIFIITKYFNLFLSWQG